MSHKHGHGQVVVIYLSRFPFACCKDIMLSNVWVWVMSHEWKSVVTQSPTCKTMSHLWTTHVTHDWLMVRRVSVSHVTVIAKTCHTRHACVMSHMNESWSDVRVWVMSRARMSHVTWMSHVTHQWVMDRCMSASHVTLTNESCRACYEWVMSYMNESWSDE